MRIIFLLFLLLTVIKNTYAQNEQNLFCPIHNEGLVTKIVEVTKEDEDENIVVCSFTVSLESDVQERCCPYSESDMYKKNYQFHKSEKSFVLSYCKTCNRNENKYLIIGGEWQSYYSAEGAFKINFPDKPVINIDKGNNPEEASIYAYSSSSTFARYSIEVTVYPQPYIDLEQVLIDWLPEINTSYRGYPGFQQLHKTDTSILCEKRFLIENKLYEINIIMPVFAQYSKEELGYSPEEIVDEFMDSFEIQ